MIKNELEDKEARDIFKQLNIWRQEKKGKCYNVNIDNIQALFFLKDMPQKIIELPDSKLDFVTILPVQYSYNNVQEKLGNIIFFTKSSKVKLGKKYKYFLDTSVPCIRRKPGPNLGPKHRKKHEIEY